VLTLVLNLGLKSMRAAIFDTDGRLRSIAYKPISTLMGEGRVEQDPRDWWRAAEETAAEVLSDRSTRAGVGIITVTASAGCLVPMAADGRSLGQAIMISDVRARPQAQHIEASQEFRDVSIPRVTPDLMLPKILWLSQEDPERYERTRWFATPNDFLIHRLTGEVVTDSTSASKYLFDPRLELYPERLVRSLGIDQARLPNVVAGPDSVLPLLPSVRDELGLRSGVQVVLSTYDAICAVYGSGVGSPGEACDVSGTVTSFRAVSDTGIVDPSGRLFFTPHLRPGRYLAGGSNNLGGGVVEWAKQVLYPDCPDPYETMVREVESTPAGAAGLIFLPYLLGERAPLWNPLARGVFFGLGRNHGRPDMMRAVLEGVGYSVLDIASRLTEIGVGVELVSASGGLARIVPVCQIKADMLGVPVRLVAELETTALGAALVSGVRAGRWPSIEEAIGACVRFGRIFEPVAARTAMYRDFFGIFRGLYEELTPLYEERQRRIDDHAEVLHATMERRENL